MTAVLTQFQQFQSCQHSVCCSWCCQADCCHRPLTLILLCIYTILPHILNSKYALVDLQLDVQFFLQLRPVLCVQQQHCVHAVHVCCSTLFYRCFTATYGCSNTVRSIWQYKFPHWFSYTLIYSIRKMTCFSGDTSKIKASNITVSFVTSGSLFKVPFSLTHQPV